MTKAKPKSKIVNAVGTAVGQHDHASAQSSAIEAAMVKAIENAHAAGISDPKAIRKLILEARNAAVG